MLTAIFGHAFEPHVMLQDSDAHWIWAEAQVVGESQTTKQFGMDALQATLWFANEFEVVAIKYCPVLLIIGWTCAKVVVVTVMKANAWSNDAILARILDRQHG